MAAAFHEICKPVNTLPSASSRDMVPTSHLPRHSVQAHAWTRFGVTPEEVLHAKNMRRSSLYETSNTKTQQSTKNRSLHLVSSIGVLSAVLAILQWYSWGHFQRRSKAELSASPCGAPCCSRPSQGPMLTWFVPVKAINTMRIESKQTQVHPGSSHWRRMPRQANRLWGKLTRKHP